MDTYSEGKYQTGTGAGTGQRRDKVSSRQGRSPVPRSRKVSTGNNATRNSSTTKLSTKSSEDGNESMGEEVDGAVQAVPPSLRRTSSASNLKRRSIESDAVNSAEVNQTVQSARTGDGAGTSTEAVHSRDTSPAQSNVINKRNKFVKPQPQRAGSASRLEG